jgi:hypothetical protein
MRLPQRICLPLLITVCGSLWATRPEHRVYSSVEEFLKGEFKGVSVSSDGRLAPAPAFRELFDTAEAFVYDLVPWSGGFLAATGNNGKILQLDASGKGSVLATLEEPAVYALAVDSQGRIYAATSPDGRVYRISADGKAEKFYEPGEKYIWDLAVDDAGNLYVATGPKGIVYRVNPAGEGRTFFDSEETHIVTLTWDLNRNLLAGSAPQGLLFRLNSSGNPFVLLDSSLEEIRSIVVDRYGMIYAAALSGGGKPAADRESSPAPREAEGQAPLVDSAVQTVTPGQGTRLQLYRIDRDNLAQTIYSSDDELAFDLSLRNDGTILLATGNRGRIVALSPQGFLTLLADLPEEQVTRVIEQGGSLFAATANLGKVFRLGTAVAGSGTYESEVLDAGITARWGTIRWRVLDPTSPDSTRLYTRSGNTARPDGTWSPWEGPYTSASGSPIRSVPARFLQWKLEFSPAGGDGALISSRDSVDLVAVSYQQSNLPPRLSNLTVMAPGVALIKSPANQSGGVQPGGPDGAYLRSLPPNIRRLDAPAVSVPSRKVYLPGARSFTWKAQDPNDDDLFFSLFLRRQGDDRWVPLAENLLEEEYTLDGASLADGVYQLKVVASDQLSNPPGQAATHELVTKPFVIANRVPVADWQPVEVQGQSATVRFTARASVSPLYRVEYTLDGKNWSILLPDDGIPDTPEERFELSLSGLKSGRYTITVRMVGSAAQNFAVR